MLQLPESGFLASVSAHNVRIDVLADWIEATALFLQTSVSQVDVIDILCENNVYKSQDFARERVSDGWLEVRRRVDALGLGKSPFEVSRAAVTPVCTWQESSAYSFCLLVSLQEWYRKWAKQFGSDYSEQGDLFERLAEESLAAQGWSALRTGWSSSHVSRLPSLVQDVASLLGESLVPGGVGRWTKKTAKEAGLDVVCLRPFADGRGGRPLVFLQVASGGGWRVKLGTPDIRMWTKLIDFTNDPQSGFIVPFSLLEDDFRLACLRGNGLVLDRTRLLHVKAEASCDWVSSPLARSMNQWMIGRVRALPRAS